MNNIADVAKLFDTQEKWDAFIDLYHQKDNIKYYWFDKLRNQIGSHFNEKNEGWGFKFIKSGIDDVRWFLNEYGENSICIALEADKISVWCQDALFDSTKAKKLLRGDSKYKELDNLIRIVFPYSEERGGYLASKNIKFLSSGTADSLAWYAQSCTKEFLDKIVDIVERFTTPEITILLSDLNKEVKKT